MRRVLWVGVLVPASLLVLAGCATRGWVREMVGQKEQEIDRRIVTVETRVSEGAQRVEGMGFRITGIEGTVQNVGETAKGAAARADSAWVRADTAYSRADSALARADDVDSRLTRLWSTRFARDAVETVHVQFRFNSAELTDAAQTSLSALVKELQSNQKLTVDLEGYTDTAGDRNYNVQLAERRVAAVRRYLVQRGVELPRVNAIGLGPLPDRGVPEVQKRRVTVKLMLHAE
jgi:outer membrane protein OmpA-like peptidoglycan-associated protein